MKVCINILIFFILTAFPVFSKNGVGDSLLQQLTDNYLLKTPFQISFDIEQQLVGEENKLEYSGEFYLHSKNCFLMNFSNQEILYDGEWLWSYEKLRDEVIVEEFDPSSSLKLIYDIFHGNWTDFSVINVEHKCDSIARILLKSTDNYSFFKSIELNVNTQKSEVLEASYIDFQDNSTDIIFNQNIQISKNDSVLFKIKEINKDKLIDLRP